MIYFAPLFAHVIPTTMSICVCLSLLRCRATIPCRRIAAAGAEVEAEMVTIAGDDVIR